MRFSIKNISIFYSSRTEVIWSSNAPINDGKTERDGASSPANPDEQNKNSFHRLLGKKLV